MLELASLGSLYTVLHHHKNRVGGKPLPLAMALRLALGADVAAALGYLRAQKVVHRDVKSHNLLLFPGWRVKLCDFGLALTADELSDGGGTRPRPGRGTFAWLSPEAIADERYSYESDAYVGGGRGGGGLTAANHGRRPPPTMTSTARPAATTSTTAAVSPAQPPLSRPGRHLPDLPTPNHERRRYALGTTLYELARRRLPFEGMADADISTVVISGGRPLLAEEPGDEHVPTAIQELMLSLWAKRTVDRPPAAEVRVCRRR